MLSFSPDLQFFAQQDLNWHANAKPGFKSVIYVFVRRKVQNPLQSGAAQRKSNRFVSSMRDENNRSTTEGTTYSLSYKSDTKDIVYNMYCFIHCNCEKRQFCTEIGSIEIYI